MRRLDPLRWRASLRWLRLIFASSRPVSGAGMISASPVVSTTATWRTFMSTPAKTPVSGRSSASTS